jgi:hypothetical protein
MSTKSKKSNTTEEKKDAKLVFHGKKFYISVNKDSDKIKVTGIELLGILMKIESNRVVGRTGIVYRK